MLQQNTILNELQQIKGLQPETGVRDNPVNRVQTTDSRADTERRFEQTMAATRQQAERQEQRNQTERLNQREQQAQRQLEQRQSLERREQQRLDASRNDAEPQPRSHKRDEIDHATKPERTVAQNTRQQSDDGRNNESVVADNKQSQASQTSTNSDQSISNSTELNKEASGQNNQNTVAKNTAPNDSAKLQGEALFNKQGKAEKLTELMTKIAALLSDLQGDKQAGKDASLSLQAIINKMNQAGVKDSEESSNGSDAPQNELMAKIKSLLQALIGGSEQGPGKAQNQTDQVQQGEWDFEKANKVQLSGDELEKALQALNRLVNELTELSASFSQSESNDNNLQHDLDGILNSLKQLSAELSLMAGQNQSGKTQGNDDAKTLSWLTNVMSQAELSKQGANGTNGQLVEPQVSRVVTPGKGDGQFALNSVSSALLKEANIEVKATQNSDAAEDISSLKGMSDNESQVKLAQILTPTKPIQLNGAQTSFNALNSTVNTSESGPNKLGTDGKLSTEMLNDLKAVELAKGAETESELKPSNLKTLLESGFLQSDKPASPTTKVSTVEVAGVQLDKTLQAPKLEQIVQTKNDVVIKENILFNKQELANNIQTQVGLMMARNMKSVDIRLDPPELGSIQVKLSLGEQANVSFVVSTQQAKDALEDSLPKLREMLEKQGMELGNSDVSKDDSNGNESGEEEQNQTQLAGQMSESENVDAEEQQLAAKIASPWQVDYYA
ncbi:flagellar hook-length control protein FliK [Psychrosphaera ytuae]|uniref:Flagellar hook-length control protein FliK n=1 Tax=Psychrosphaera ytuae TaxID=2820710 RepID=A0A975DB95_9GAMM|nr:flagellar hook-length control protein FliK [Psychrosphaera ytuae]QTH63768.1 flagellar hook-length control protein FliK [Psychrosphaera ytuae]